MALTNALQYIRFNASLLLLKLSHGWYQGINPAGAFHVFQLRPVDVVGEPPTPICLIFFSYLPKIKRDLKTWAAMASTKVQRIMIQLIVEARLREGRAVNMRMICCRKENATSTILAFGD
ncbi:hypothetical protein IGI04_016104 [Brassica rapa subsp. trilocularis]|uniref:Uncharacterized protein n=1 Tax=Brassica rapa subsp. trilocularis TaxID=1813537 RepID=A0ABQ7MS67_BRACM|nr:hypothetical protein IGI04_016104 [Brassica rapa subsp. trilocularis]